MSAGLLGAVIVFWGWQANFLSAAVFMALLVEVPRFFPRRFNLSSRDLEAIADVCTCLVLLLVFYLFFSRQTQYLIIFLLEFMPLPLFPLLVAQRLSTQDTIDLTALFYFLRKRKEKGVHFRSRSINFEYLYFGLCLLSAGAANQRAIWYYALAFVFIAWVLWNVKPKSTPFYTWGIFLLLAGVLGYAGQMGLQELQKLMQVRIISSSYDGSSDISLVLFEAGSLLGKIKKVFDEILFRVTIQNVTRDGVNYIRKAVFDVSTGREWYASREFAGQRPKLQQTNSSYALNSANASDGSMNIFKEFSREQDYLLLPKGALAVSNLSVSNLKIISTGSVIVQDPGQWMGYGVKYNSKSSILKEPSGSDLQIPHRINKEIIDIASSLDIRDSNNPKRVIRILQRFFRNEFTYSVNVEFKSNPLQSFLFKKQAGDCEYFATAAALLLRSSGIPCRYVTGYLVHECDLKKNMCVVRKSDAHAWVTAFVHGEWIRIDTTPPGVAYHNPGWIREAMDFFSRLSFEFKKWRYQENITHKLIYICLFVLSAAMFLGVLKRWWQNKSFQEAYITTSETMIHQGGDSEFYKIEQKLRSRDMQRPAAQPLLEWIREQDDSLLEDIVLLHYKYRFDPQGLNKEERKRLKEQVDKWLKQNR